MSNERQRVSARWATPEVASSYATRRFRTARAASRDLRLVGALLSDYDVRGRILDAPCGTGRLRETLESFAASVVGADVSHAMLAQARAAHDARCVLADIARLPFSARQFDVVVCCRLLHHLRELDELQQVVNELVRVSDRLVLASFWDSSAWPTWRARAGWSRPRGRFATSRAAIEAAFSRAGAQTLEFRGVLRFVSQQTFVVAVRT